MVLVVADRCSDNTAVLATTAGAQVTVINARDVGRARAAAAKALLASGCRWLAFTDSDTLVSPTWLADQLSLDLDAVCGTVGVDDWTAHGVHAGLLEQRFIETCADRDEYAHIHGVNLVCLQPPIGAPASSSRSPRSWRTRGASILLTQVAAGHEGSHPHGQSARGCGR